MNSYLYIKFLDVTKEKIVNKLKNINVSIYDLKKDEKNVIVKINLKDYEKIQKYLITIDYQKIKYLGPEYFKVNLKKYLFFVINFCVSLFLIILLSNVIVDIEIVHEDQSLVLLVSNNLEKNGLKKFHLRKSFKKIEEIKEKIKNDNLDKIEWLEIERKGMKYIVKVEKRIINKETPEKNYCHVYAKKDGTITGIQISKGVSMVGINDYVHKGDILLSGDITFNDNNVNKVCASGKIFANTWYEVNITLPINYSEETKTGKKRYNFIIDYNDVEKQIFVDRLDNYVTSKKLIFNLLGLKIYLKKDEEVTKINKQYSLDEGTKKAIDLAKEKVQMNLANTDEITLEKVLQKNINDSTISVDVFVVAKEQIGIVKEVPEGETNDS